MQTYQQEKTNISDEAEKNRRPANSRETLAWVDNRPIAFLQKKQIEVIQRMKNPPAPSFWSRIFSWWQSPPPPPSEEIEDTAPPSASPSKSTKDFESELQRVNVTEEGIIGSLVLKSRFDNLPSNKSKGRLITQIKNYQSLKDGNVILFLIDNNIQGISLNGSMPTYLCNAYYNYAPETEKEMIIREMKFYYNPTWGEFFATLRGSTSNRISNDNAEIFMQISTYIETTDRLSKIFEFNTHLDKLATLANLKFPAEDLPLVFNKSWDCFPQLITLLEARPTDPISWKCNFTKSTEIYQSTLIAFAYIIKQNISKEYLWIASLFANKKSAVINAINNLIATIFTQDPTNIRTHIDTLLKEFFKLDTITNLLTTISTPGCIWAPYINILSPALLPYLSSIEEDFFDSYEELKNNPQYAKLVQVAPQVFGRNDISGILIANPIVIDQLIMYYPAFSKEEYREISFLSSRESMVQWFISSHCVKRHYLFYLDTTDLSSRNVFPPNITFDMLKEAINSNTSSLLTKLNAGTNNITIDIKGIKCTFNAEIIDRKWKVFALYPQDDKYSIHSDTVRVLGKL